MNISDRSKYMQFPKAWSAGQNFYLLPAIEKEGI